MKPGQVDSWSGHQRCQAPHEFHGAKYHMSGAIVVGRLQGDDHIAELAASAGPHRPGVQHCLPSVVLRTMDRSHDVYS